MVDRLLSILSFMDRHDDVRWRTHGDDVAAVA